MASPIISTFRRNQGYILAVMGVVLIITWVIGPTAVEFFTGGGSRGREQTQPIVVQWNKGGTPQFVSEGDLVHLRQEHMAVLDFVQRVVSKASAGGFTPQAPGLNLTPNQRGDISLGLPMDNTEATVVNIQMFAERGRELGVRVDKDAMVHYLRFLSGGSMEEGDFRDVAKETVKDAVKSGKALSVDGLFSALRRELVAQQAIRMLNASVTNISTGELWDLHKQLNLRYRIEAYPIDVEKLKETFKAADAKPDELIALFNKGKDRVPNPDLPEPGFKTPHRIAFGYCTVDFEVFLRAAKKNVPEEKALERYKTGIAQGDFRKPPKPPVTEKPKETKPGEEKPAGEEKKPGEPEKKEEPKPGEPKPEEKPVEKPGEKAAEPAKEKPAAEKPAAEKPAEEKPAEEKPATVAVKCDDEPAKSAKADEAKAAPEKTPAKEEAKTEPAKTEPAKTEPAKTPDATPAGEKIEDPATTEKKEEKKEEKEEIQHKPYEEVKDDIITELAQAEAAQLRDAAVQDAMDELRLYSTKLKRFADSKKEKLTDVEDPGEFRPASFANKYKFAFGKTGLVDRHQAADTELGKFAILQQGPQGSITFAQMAFFVTANLYDPHEASSIVGDTRYIYWRIDDQPEQDVELEKDGSLPPAVKAQVEQAWLKQKAFDAAKKQAEALAAKVKGTTLRELVGKTEEAKVALPVPFSMFTSDGFLAFGSQPRYSQPNGVPMAGKEFMDAVFSLQPGEAGVAFDQPHNVVYVVHVLADEPSLEIRREMFLTSLQRGQYTDLAGFANIERQAEMQSLFDDLEKHFSVKWVRSPNMGREE